MSVDSSSPAKLVLPIDRSVLTELTRIMRNKRKLESEILSEFEQIKPKVLGCILHVLVKAFRIKSNLQLNDIPQMAYFALWGEQYRKLWDTSP
jgi:hypothetical protein